MEIRGLNYIDDYINDRVKNNKNKIGIYGIILKVNLSLMKRMKLYRKFIGKHIVEHFLPKAEKSIENHITNGLHRFWMPYKNIMIQRAKAENEVLKQSRLMLKKIGNKI